MWRTSSRAPASAAGTASTPYGISPVAQHRLTWTEADDAAGNSPTSQPSDRIGKDTIVSR